MLVADLQPDERDQFPEAVWDEEIDKWCLPKRPDGACVHLVDGKCSVYHQRPRACRSYDCRRYLVGFPPERSGNRDYVVEAFERWGEWRIETPEDVDALFAWHRACSEGLQSSASDLQQLRMTLMIGVSRLLPRAHEARDQVGFSKAKALVRDQDRRLRSELLDWFARLKIVPWK